MPGVTSIDSPVVLEIYNARDWGVGFISPTPLPLGADAVITLNLPSRPPLAMEGYVLRCRRLPNFWHEGAIIFYRGYPALLAEFPDSCAAKT
jgi:hypothetical protein